MWAGGVPSVYCLLVLCTAMKHTGHDIALDTYVRYWVKSYVLNLGHSSGCSR
jgi:hypothetical protein